MAKLNKTLTALLQTLVAAGPNGVTYVDPTQGEALAKEGYAEVNTAATDPNQPGKVGARATAAGAAFINGSAAPAASAAPAPATAAPAASSYAVITGAVLPPAAPRGGGAGRESIYPFATLDVGGSFFVPATADRPEPAKSMGSTIATAEKRFGTVTGKKTVTRSKRDPQTHKTVVDAAGQPVKETVQVDVWNLPRKFVARAVKAGTVYGSWTAPSDGALIQRTA